MKYGVYLTGVSRKKNIDSLCVLCVFAVNYYVQRRSVGKKVADLDVKLDTVTAAGQIGADADP